MHEYMYSQLHIVCCCYYCCCCHCRGGSVLAVHKPSISQDKEGPQKSKTSSHWKVAQIENGSCLLASRWDLYLHFFSGVAYCLLGKRKKDYAGSDNTSSIIKGLAQLPAPCSPSPKDCKKINEDQGGLHTEAPTHIPWPTPLTLGALFFCSVYRVQMSFVACLTACSLTYLVSFILWKNLNLYIWRVCQCNQCKWYP
jgi:hypothetical protein